MCSCWNVRVLKEKQCRGQSTKLFAGEWPQQCSPLDYQWRLTAVAANEEFTELRFTAPVG